MPLLFISAWRQFQVALHRLTGLAVAPVPQPHQQVDARASAAELVLAAALVAKPGAAALQVVKAVAIPAAAQRAGLVAAIELGRLQAAQGSEQVAPAAQSRRDPVGCHEVSSVQRLVWTESQAAPGRAPLGPCSAAMAASSTWRSTAERLRAPWRRRCSSQASWASVIETLKGDANEAMQTRNSEPSLSTAGKAC